METKHVHLGSKWVLLGMGLLLWTVSSACAIVGDVSVGSAGQPVAGAKISFQTADGQVVAEGESDDDGKAVILIPDSHKKKRLTLIVSKGDRKTTQTVDVGEGDKLKVDVDLPGSAPAPRKPATTTPAPQKSATPAPIPQEPATDDGWRFAVGVTGFYKWAGFDGSHDYVTGGLSARGDLDGHSPGVGVDLQVQPPDRFLHGWPLCFILGFGVPFDLDETNVWADYHPTPGMDSFLSVDENWFLRLLVAWRLLTIHQTQVSLLGGVQFTDVDVEFSANESGGMGVPNRFDESETMVTPVLGLGLVHPLGNTAMQLVANWYITWLDDVSGRGVSTLGLVYRYNVDGGIQTDFHLGVRIPIR